jgi:CPA2 family monovalent cation:H+ antiporter-2
MSLAQIGEFSFIIAGVGAALGATGDFLYPVAVTVSAVTTLLTPWLIRAAAPVASLVDRKLPHPLQTFVALYGSWIEQLRRPDRQDLTAAAEVRRLARLLLIDGALLAAIMIGAAVSIDRLAAFVAGHVTLGRAAARAVVLLAAAVLSLPFLIGVVRVARRFGDAVAAIAFPGKRAEDPTPADSGVDLAAAPRRALVVTLQLACVLLVGAPILAVTQPFLHGFETAAGLTLLLAVLGIAFWRSATNLEGHVRAGAQVIVERLARQLQPAPAGAHASGEHLAPAAATTTTTGPGPHAELDRLLPGLGAPEPITLDASSAAVGRTLATLNLRAATGATVLVILRDGAGVIPTADEPLRAGDVLALAGTREALAAATEMLRGAGAPEAA